jgi:hypothetical protein
MTVRDVNDDRYDVFVSSIGIASNQESIDYPSGTDSFAC